MKMTTGKAIKALQRRVDWLVNQKVNNKEYENKLSFIAAELEATEWAIELLKELRDKNIQNNGSDLQCHTQ